MKRALFTIPILRTKVPFLSLLSVAWVLPSFLSAESPVAGTWQTIDDETNQPKSIVEIWREPNGEIRGKVVKVIIWSEGSTGFCDKCPGEMQGKPIEGLTILWGMEADGEGAWSGGRILDPKKGKIYKCKLKLSDEGDQLKVRGYIGFSLIGRTQVWYRMKEEAPEVETETPARQAEAGSKG